MPIGPTRLFDHLVKNREKITYERAYEVLIRPLSGPWRNQVQAQEVVGKISGTLPREVNGLSIGLDALVGSADGGVPAEGHVKKHRYDYAKRAWIHEFGDWEFCVHETF